MKNTKFSKITIFLIFAVIVLFLMITVGNYRFTPLSAAKAHFDVGSEVTVFGDVDFGWSRIYVLDTENGPRTVISLSSLFLWRAPAATCFDISEDVIKTVGWMSYFDKKGHAAVFAVLNSDPDVTLIRVGADIMEIQKDIPLIVKLDTGTDFNDIKPAALNDEGEVLYEYRYPLNTSILRDEDLKWYKVD